MNKVLYSILAILSILHFSGSAQAQDAHGVFETIPSPIETSAMIKGLNAKYKKSNLNDNAKASSYTTQYQKALNLGVYSADLGVANLYEQNQDVINYLDAVKSLADQLQIGQFFEYSTLKKFATQSDKLQELLDLTNSNVQKINEHLTSNRREHISVLMVTGGWIESNYLMTKVYAETKNAKLREKIGEQKIVIDQLLPAVKKFSAKPGFSKLIANLESLKKKYSTVKITKTEGEKVMEIVDGAPVYKDTSVTTVTISDATYNSISAAYGSLRASIIK